MKLHICLLSVPAVSLLGIFLKTHFHQYLCTDYSLLYCLQLQSTRINLNAHVGEWLNKLCYVHTKEYCENVKKEWGQSLWISLWTDVEGLLTYIVQWKEQSAKSICNMLPFRKAEKYFMRKCTCIWSFVQKETQERKIRDY